MSATYAKLFRSSLVAFPAGFRDRFADEMELVFAERCADRAALTRPFFAADEIAATVITGLRFRLAGNSRKQTMRTAVVLAMLATTLTMRGVSPEPVSRIDFSGHDPAGVFTLTVVNGKAIAATLNRVEVSRSQILQKKDSISIVGDDGVVALAVRFDKQGQISWTARQ